MKTALVIIAEGCEELEAVTVIDLLRRARVHVTVAGLSADPVTASRGVRLLPDIVLGEVMSAGEDAAGRFDLVALPGGLGGVRNLAESQQVEVLLQRQFAEGRLVGAICAAPAALLRFGLLSGRTVTSYPGAIPADDPNYTYTDEPVVKDGSLITSRGPGTAIDFSLALIEELAGEKVRAEVEAGLVRS